MKGYSHAVSGAALWTLVAAPPITIPQISPDIPVIPLAPGWLEVSPTTYALGLMLSSGAALLLDSDHHSGTIAYSLPKIGPIPSPTMIMCRVIAKISGGHRHGTHSILGILAFTALAFLAGYLVVDINGTKVALGSGLFAFFLTAFTMKVFRVGKKNAWIERWSLSLAFAAAVTWWFPNEWNVLPLIVFIGCFAHAVGDMLTVGGVPWFYPWTPDSPKFIRKIPVLRKMWQKNGWFSIPILGKTDSIDDDGNPTREKALTFLLSMYIIVVGIITSIVYLGLMKQG